MFRRLEWDVEADGDPIAKATFHQRFWPGSSKGILWRLGDSCLQYGSVRRVRILRAKPGPVMAAWRLDWRQARYEGVIRTDGNPAFYAVIIGCILADLLWHEDL